MQIQKPKSLRQVTITTETPEGQLYHLIITLSGYQYPTPKINAEVELEVGPERARWPHTKFLPDKTVLSTIMDLVFQEPTRFPAEELIWKFIAAGMKEANNGPALPEDPTARSEGRSSPRDARKASQPSRRSQS